MYVMRMSVCMSMCHIHVSSPQMPADNTGSSGTRVTGIYEPPPPCGCWEINPGNLKNQPMVLTTGHLSNP